MVSKMNRPKKSTISSLLGLAFFGWLFSRGMGAPAVTFWIPAVGLLSSSALTVYYWRRERKADAKTAPVGIWILLGVVLLFIVLCLLLPAL